MDAEALAAELGASNSHLATNVDEALSIIENQTIRAAILDFDLDGENSVPIADRLVEDNIPFVFATGYDDPSFLPERHQNRPVLKKPFSAEDIRTAFTPSQS